MPIIRTGGSGPDEPKFPGGPPGGGSQAPTSREGVTLADLYGALRRHLLLVLVTTAVVGALAAVSVLLEVPTYRATAVLRLTDSRQTITQGLAERPSDPPRQGLNPLLS